MPSLDRIKRDENGKTWPVEPKVKAATYASALSSGLFAFLTTGITDLLQAKDTGAIITDLSDIAEPFVIGGLTAGITAAVTFASAWLAKHQIRVPLTGANNTVASSPE